MQKFLHYNSHYDFYGHDGNASGYRSIMFYRPDKKLTQVILTNFHGADLYAIARALYAAIPDFTCGNKKDDKINVCLWQRNLCVPRVLASRLIQYAATLGQCECSLPSAKKMDIANRKLITSPAQQNMLEAFPNPFSNTVSFSFRSTESGQATIGVYDMNGKLLATVFNGFVQKGILQKVEFNGSNLPAGMYLSRLQTSTGITELKLLRIQ